MDESLYLQIIQKQQELISLMCQAGFGNGMPVAPGAEMPVGVPSKKGYETFDEQGFINYLQEKGRAKHSIDTYVTHVKLFFNEFGTLTVETLSEYEKSIQKYQPNTVNLKTVSMGVYLGFIGFTEYRFKKQKIQKKTFCNTAINEEQYKKLLDWAKDNQPNVWLIARVIAGTGVRVSELIELKTADLEKGYKDITGKGNKIRRIYFPKKLVEDIKEKCGAEYIVENRYGGKITTRGIEQILKKAAPKSGVPVEVMHPHSFRHFFAKQFLKERNDISLLGDLLGHSNLSTTAIYTRMTAEEQQKEINNLVNW